SSIRFALFFLAEFMNTVTMSAVIVTLFLGGPNAPFGIGESVGGVIGDWLLPVFWFVLKLFVFLFGYVWLRAALPRLRYDQLMDLGWKVLIPAALAWLMVIALIQIAPSSWAGRAAYLLGGVGVGVLSAAMLLRSLKLGRATVLEEDLHG
ncbi:MAG: NADH-quinone oxidoreductase subunit, partial [Actinomycetota bacterium]|nr:NADH-quinone oxidoreductase subunit [Actinomycetota bacterium]